MKRFLTLLLAVILGQLLLLAAIVVVIAGQLMDKPKLRDGSVLVQALDGDIPEYDLPGGLPIGQPATTHTAILENLEKARYDKRITAVVLDLGSARIGFAKAEELRERIGQLQAAKKPVWAYAHWLTARTLSLGSACDSLFLMPHSYVAVRGMGAERMFARGLLDKIGVRPNLHQIEHYKSAAEMMLRSDLSPESRDNIEWILDEIYPAVIQTTESDRELPAGTLENRVMREGILDPEEALELDLIDAIAYWDEVETRLLQLQGVKADEKEREKLHTRPRTIAGSDYAGIARQDAGIKGKKKIAVVHAQGLIMGEESTINFPLGATMGAATMASAFREAAEDEDVAAIIFRVDSGGGESTTSWRIQHAAMQAEAVKPVVVSMLDVAGSGGYMICYPCQTLVANRLSIVGSIGSISGKFNMHGLYDKLGITKDFVTRGPNALMDSDYADYTPEQWASFTARHWRDYQTWVADIAKYRHKTPAEIDSLGRGRVWTGTQALELGLIDRLGTFDDAVAIAKEKAGIAAADEVEFVHLPAKKGLLQSLRSGGLGAVLFKLLEMAIGPFEGEATWAVDWNRYR